MATQTTDPVYTFTLFRRHPEHVIAIFQCVKKHPYAWFSPPNAPFGGVQCHVDSREHELFFFINCIKKWINDRSGKTLTIKTAASCYEPESQLLLHSVYLNTGFVPIQACVNSFISVNEQHFITHIKSSEKRKLKKAVLAGFQAGLANALSSQFVYDFLAQCRAGNGYYMPLTLGQIENSRQKFPDAYQIFAVSDQERIIALTLTVRVNDQILYNFLCGDLPEYRVYSPVVMLMACVYRYCQHEQIQLLDLGISLDGNGDYKPSLGRFKRNIGGKECLKMTYEFTFR